MNNLKEQYNKEIIPALQDKLGLKNKMSVPKMVKVVVNFGYSPNKRDGKFLENVKNNLLRITGQKYVETKARKSIAGFKVREGMVVGVKVTLRGERMYDFVEKLIKVALPRVRDFRGLETSVVDDSGNLNLGIKEHIVFPEIKSDEVEEIHSLEVTIVSNAKDNKEGMALFRLLGFPIKKESKK